MVRLDENDYVLDFCDYTHIFIPKNCRGITDNAYEAVCIFADQRQCITVEQGNEKYVEIGNCLIDKTLGRVVLGCKDSVIPNDGSIKIIGAHAFRSIGGMECESRDEFSYISIPDSVEIIEHHAFADTGLTHIDFPQGLKKIGSMAFMLSRLGMDDKEISLPETVTRLGVGIFAGCRHLKRLHFCENEYYKSQSDCIIDKTEKSLIAVHCGAFAEILPDDAHSIELLTFLGQNKGTRYYIGENYKEIKASPAGLPLAIEFPITILAKRNSYAHRFATENGIAYEEWK